MQNLEPVLWNAPSKPYHGKSVYATHVAAHKDVNQYYSLPKEERKAKLFMCVDCKQYVVWTKSKRTGRSYLCDTYRSSIKLSRNYTAKDCYFVPSRPHKCGA